jgi:hypothetical protein
MTHGIGGARVYRPRDAWGRIEGQTRGFDPHIPHIHYIHGDGSYITLYGASTLGPVLDQSLDQAKKYEAEEVKATYD